jgi:hypothetical protein
MSDEALAAILRRALEDGTARVVYTAPVGGSWWLQVDRTRVSAAERAALDAVASGEPERTIEELIEASSLGTPEAKAARESADPVLVQRVMSAFDNDSAYRRGSADGVLLALFSPSAQAGEPHTVFGRRFTTAVTWLDDPPPSARLETAVGVAAAYARQHGAL